jgi:Xaa-Pro aminopeptidase
VRVRTAVIAALGACVVSSLSPGDYAAAAGPRAAGPPAVREAPAAPAFREEERHAELRARRERVAAKLGPNSLLVMFSAEPRLYTNDVDFEFRQENNLYYVTALRQKGATLVMLPGAAAGAREILFLPRRDPRTETWDGRMYSPEEARAASGVGEIWDAREFEPFMRAVRERRAYRPAPENVLLSSAESRPAPAAFDALFAAMARNDARLFLLLNGGEQGREFRREQEFAAEWAKAPSGLTARSAWDVFAELRMRKSPYELRLLQHAVDISIEGHQRAQAVASRSRWEYEVEAELDYTYKRRNADNWGYPSIVGCGPNGTTLHYQESQGRVGPGDLILIDAGAEYDHYTADVTRTFPAGGRFTPAQAEIYNVVLAAQEAAFRAIRPGVDLSEVHRAAEEVIRDGLLRLGLITDRNSLQFRVWFMHGTSHWLGMNVHDVSVRGAKLDAGMVFTVEPGIYIRPDALDHLPKTAESEKFIAAVRPAFEKYKGVGVRIEDDVVVTADGHRNLSAALPRSIPDIESFMERAQKEVRVGFLAPYRWRDEGE